MNRNAHLTAPTGAARRMSHCSPAALLAPWILQSGCPTSEKTDVLVDALRGEDLDAVHVRPDLRELLFPGSLDEPVDDGPTSDEPTAAAG